jgi:hypothetical protein
MKLNSKQQLDFLKFIAIVLFTIQIYYIIFL